MVGHCTSVAFILLGSKGPSSTVTMVSGVSVGLFCRTLSHQAFPCLTSPNNYCGKLSGR